jgi:hypothetical protein
MATPRKRSPGFTNQANEVTEEALLEEFLDVAATEVFESISQKEEEASEEKQAEKPFVEEIIVPTEDLGPRFLEKEEEPAPAPQPKPAPELKPAPRRHPRNVPKFSRTR